MIQAEHITGGMWRVTETDGETVLWSKKVAVKAGEGEAEAIALATHEPPAPTTEERAAAQQAAAKAECRRRILAVCNETTQMNLAAAAATGQMSDAHKASYRAWLAWVNAMRAACAKAEDWPEPPRDVAALAALF